MCRQDDSIIVLVDIQDRLLATIMEPARTRMLDNTTTLLKTAELLDIPVIYTEQYPQGLGSTAIEIRTALPGNARYFDKTHFSCCGSEDFLSAVRASHKRQVIITGMESHICVMQTALELKQDGFEVFVADDAVCSRKMAHWKSALNRLRQAGVVAAPTESILFEWLRHSHHEQFKSVSALLR